MRILQNYLVKDAKNRFKLMRISFRKLYHKKSKIIAVYSIISNSCLLKIPGGAGTMAGVTTDDNTNN